VDPLPISSPDLSVSKTYPETESEIAMNKEKGFVFSVGEEQTGTSDHGPWRRQEFIIKQPGQSYDNYLPFQLKGEMVDSCPSVGTEVEIEFFINGRLGKGKYEGRAFLDLAVKNINVLTGASNDNGEAPF